MKKDIYLSLDLDFWKNKPFAHFQTLFEELIDRKLPIKVVPHHQQLLPHINKYQCPVLFNVDYHSDIGDNPKPYKAPELNCGTWANHVKIQSMELFVWMFASMKCVQNYDGKKGLCNEDGSQFCNENPDKNPFFAKNPKPLCFWDSAVLRDGQRDFLQPREIDRVRAVGIAISYAWGGSVHYNVFQNLMQIHHKRFSKKRFYWTE
jgi:hypothetical protein